MYAGVNCCECADEVQPDGIQPEGIHCVEAALWKQASSHEGRHGRCNFFL
jgi:hypothetical protein